jgi:Terminase small subunit
LIENVTLRKAPGFRRAFSFARSSGMTIRSLKALHPRHHRFIAEYMIDLSGKEAAIRSGYKASNATKRAHRLLRDPLVQRELKKQMARRARRTRLSADRVLKEYGLRTYEKIRGVSK